MMDFYSNTYSLFTGLFAAIFGMSFPLVLQCIQRIDEKYESSVISREFENESTYLWFKGLLWPYIILVCASPLLLGWLSDNENLLYIFQCFMLVYILVIAVVMVLLFTRITVYYNLDRLLASFQIKQPNRDVLFCFDLAKYASEKGYQDTYFNAMRKVAECFIKERNSTPMDKPVEYSDNLNRILREIGQSVGDGDTQKSGYKSTDIISFILDSTDKHIISDKTYSYIWFMLNNAAASGNNGWITGYWTWASQYYQFRSLDIAEGKHNEEMEKFYRFNVMLGAVLNFNKRFECLKHIMSVCPNATNSYPLIPGTFAKILGFAKDLDSLHSTPMSIEAKYQILGLNKGVNTDAAITAEAYKYLAILFVRVWSYSDYNINYCDPKMLPYPSQASVDENEANIRIMEVIKRQIDSFYQNDVFRHFDFVNLPSQTEVIKLIDDFIGNCKEQNRVIFAKKGYSKEKLKKIFDETVIVNASTNFQLPKNQMDFADEDKKVVEETIVGTTQVERRFLHFGTSDECGGIGQGLAMELNLKLRQALYATISKSYTIEESKVSYNDLQGVIDGMPADNVIIDLTGGCQYNTDLKKFHVGKILLGNVLFVCAESVAPTCNVIDGKFEGEQLIDSYNYLYGSVEEDTQYTINVKQRMSIKLPQGKPLAALIFIE